MRLLQLGESAMHVAAGAAQQDVVKYLASKGARLDLPDTVREMFVCERCRMSFTDASMHYSTVIHHYIGRHATALLVLCNISPRTSTHATL